VPRGAWADARSGARPGARGLQAETDTLLNAQVRDVAAELPALLGAVGETGCRVLDVEVRSPSLHSVFIHLTGRDLLE
jgi:hypothetical protein